MFFVRFSMYIFWCNCDPRPMVCHLRGIQRNLTTEYMLYCRSKWIFLTVYWGAVGLSWGPPLFTLGLPLFALSLADFLSVPWDHSTTIKNLYLCQKYHLEDKNKICQNPCVFKTWIGYVILNKLEASFVRDFRQSILWCGLGVTLWNSGLKLWHQII